MESEEHKPLLINQSTEESGDVQEKQKSGRFPYYLLSVVIVIFACAEDLQSKVVVLYMYEILGENSDNENHTVPSSNNSGSGGSCGSKNASISENTLQTDVSHWSWYFSLLENGITIIIMMVFGIFADKIGRKPFMIFCLIGTSIRFGATAFIVFRRLNVLFLFIVYALAGISGNSSVFGICCLSLIADVTKRSNTRTMGLALFDVLIGVGLSGTEIASGYLVQLTGYIWPCVIASALSIICSVIVTIFIPETLKQTADREEGIVSTLTSLIKFYYSDKHFYSNKIWPFNLAMAIFVIIWLLFGASITTLYELGSPFCWTPEDIGWFDSATIMSHLIIGVVLIKVFHFCLRDESIACIGLVSAAVYKLIFGLATSSWMLYAATVTGIMSVTPLPILRAIMSKMVKEDKQGALFANICIIEVIAEMCSSTIFNNVYAVTQDFMRGFTFLVMAGFYTICASLFIPLIVLNKKQHREEYLVQQ